MMNMTLFMIHSITAPKYTKHRNIPYQNTLISIGWMEHHDEQEDPHEEREIDVLKISSALDDENRVKWAKKSQWKIPKASW